MQSTPLLAQKVESVLDYMQDKHVSFKDLLFHILDGKNPRRSYRRWVFDDPESILTRIDQRKRGRKILGIWALNLMYKIVDHEMRKVKKAFTMKTAEITPDFVEAWSFSSLRNVIEEAPTLCKLLSTGAQATRVRKKGKKDPMVVCSPPRLATPSIPY